MMILTLTFSFIILFRVADADHAILKQLGGWAEPLLVASNLTSLVRRQEEECPPGAPVDCGNGGCCQAGNFCYLSDLCCPDGALECPTGCAPSIDDECCGDFACKPGSSCGTAVNGDAACCPPGYFGCDSIYCCRDGTTCVSGLQCLTQITSTSTIYSTSTSTSYYTSTRLATPTATTCHATSITKLQDRRVPLATECTEECHIATGKKVKVWKVPRVAGETDQLIDSMCKGIQARAQAGQLAEGLADGEDIINYNGGGSGTRVSIVNCRGACMYSETGLQCDEYPPARWTQEGVVQTLLCIDAYQNSGTQGPMLANIVTSCNMKKGDDMLVRIEGGCSGARATPPTPRSEDVVLNPKSESTIFKRDSSWQLFSSNATIRDPYGDGSLRYIAIHLGELDDGHYDIRLNIAGQIQNISVVNVDGDVLANLNSPSSTFSLSFDVSEDPKLPRALSIIAYTNEDIVNVTASGTGTVTDTSPTSSSSSSSSVPNGTSAASQLCVSCSRGTPVLLLISLSLITYLYWLS